MNVLKGTSKNSQTRIPMPVRGGLRGLGLFRLLNAVEFQSERSARGLEIQGVPKYRAGRSCEGQPPKKSKFLEIFLRSSCPPRGNRIFFKMNGLFYNLISSFIKIIPTLVGTSFLCIILHNNTKEYCIMEHKFSKIRSSLIAHRSSLIAHRKN